MLVVVTAWGWVYFGWVWFNLVWLFVWVCLRWLDFTYLFWYTFGCVGVWLFSRCWCFNVDDLVAC